MKTASQLGLGSVIFDIYKRGQGKYTRLCSALGAAIVAGLGCLRLYQHLEAADWNLSPKTRLWVTTMVPAGLFVALSLLIFYLVNKPAIADFMIAAEGEMKKVSWSSRKEIAVSTFIVIVVVVIMAVLLGTTDVGFYHFFDWLLQ
ncbi:MAG: preprotein translocase subunit SecE [Phycisphaerae bacterium]